MKQLILITILLYWSITSSGQKIRFTDTSNHWYVKHFWHPGGQPPSTTWWHYFYRGQSVINNITYNRLCVYSENSLGHKYAGLSRYIREDTVNKTIMALDTPTAAEYLLYDGRWNIGDTVFKAYYIGGVDSILIDSVYYKRFWLTPVKPSNSVLGYYLVEGIGSMTHTAYQIISGDNYLDHKLSCFKNNGIIADISRECNDWMPTNILSDDISSSLLIYPQPAIVSATVQLPKVCNGYFQLYTSTGLLIESREVSQQSKLQVGNSTMQGLYFYRFFATGGECYFGRLLFE